MKMDPREKKRSKRNQEFYHTEEAFRRHGETVVIFCFRDFCRMSCFQGGLEKDLRSKRTRYVRRASKESRPQALNPEPSNPKPLTTVPLRRTSP